MFYFPSPLGAPVFARTYSRPTGVGFRETWREAVTRSISGLAAKDRLTGSEQRLIKEEALSLRAMPSGRALWVAGTPWHEQPENTSGTYNCTSTIVDSWEAFGLMMDLAMMGCGTGAVLERQNVALLPPICNKLVVEVTALPGTSDHRFPDTTFIWDHPGYLQILVGDSRKGWVTAYQALLEAASDLNCDTKVMVDVDMSHVRSAGEPLKGFGGVSNPQKLPELWERCARILNRAVGRQLTPLECCLLIDEAASTIVAGSIRRSAGIRQFSSGDTEAATAKQNLWVRTDAGWQIDPDRDALRMANHTRVWHTIPDLETLQTAITSQFHSGEGAIMYAPEAIARCNADVWDCFQGGKHGMLRDLSTGEAYTTLLKAGIPANEVEHRLERYHTNPCGEIIGSQFHCNLSEVHLNQIDPLDILAQQMAFRAAALSACASLHHKFITPRYQQSREWDPIVGVSITGLFDFCVQALGVPWLQWWEQGRSRSHPKAQFFLSQEESHLTYWRQVVEQEVYEYCTRHNLRVPNRSTTVQPGGTKSLLTGACPGWHPPKATRFIRRVTYRRDDPIALACMAYGYNIVPGQSDKDELGNLLNDPWDPRCSEWLVETPIEVPWANLPGVDDIDIDKFSAIAQFDFYMQVQKHYTRHNTSGTIEFRESEIEALAQAIHTSITLEEGYISVALLPRFEVNSSFPRLPFEPISRAQYERAMSGVTMRRNTGGFPSFQAALEHFDGREASMRFENGPTPCDSEVCGI